MIDLGSRVSSSAERITTRWSRERANRLWRATQRRRRLHAVLQLLALALVCVLTVAATSYWNQRGEDEQHEPAPGPAVAAASQAPPAEPRRLLELPDGVVTSREPDAELSVSDPNAHPLELRVLRGTLRFQLGTSPAGALHVLAGDVRIDVHATAFSVTRQVAETVIEVERGSVIVRSGNVVQELREGQRLTLPAGGAPTASE